MTDYGQASGQPDQTRKIAGYPGYICRSSLHEAGGGTKTLDREVVSPLFKKEVLSVEEAILELKQPVRYECVGREADFEQNVVDNIDLICCCLGLPKIYTFRSQKSILADGFYIRPDLMVRHADGSLTIFEIKKASEKYPATGATNQMGAVGQLLLYGNVLSGMIDQKIRLALIDNKIYYRTYCAFVGNKLPIAIIDFQKDRLFVPYNGWCYG